MTRREFGLSCAAAGLSQGAATRPHFLSATDAAAAIRAKKISSLELTRAAFDQNDARNPKLNAVILQFREEALARAREADRALANKRVWGPLHGVPVTIKESFAMAGVPTTAGVKEWRDPLPKQNAAAVDRLLGAGAVIIGKTNVSVMLGDWQSYNPIYGVTNNPWDLTRTPGGSTGGGAAALAAGIGQLTLGSDIGGSIRVPSHFCGIYGHKPTLELVSMRGHVPPPVSESAVPADLAVAGPLARSARDLRAAIEVLGGPNDDEARAWKWTLPAPRKASLATFRAGYVMEDPNCALSSDVAAVLDAALSSLSKAGVKLQKGYPERLNTTDSYDSYSYLLGALLNSSIPDAEIDKRREAANSRKRNPFTDSAFLPHKYWLRATGSRLAARAAWQKYFTTCDVFLVPVAFVAAFPHDHSSLQNRTLQTPEGKRPYLDLIYWVHLATLAGLPATVAPVGRTRAGQPVGIQIIGPYLEDATPIEFAALMEPATGGFAIPPNY